MLKKHLFSSAIFIFILVMITNVMGENLTATNCSDVVNFYSDGMQMLDKGNCSEAIEIFDKIINSNQSLIPEFDEFYFKVWLGKAEAEYCISNYNTTIQMCDYAISLDKNNTTQFYLLKADALLKEGRYKEATQAFKDAAELGKSDAEFWKTMGDILSKNGMHKEALEFYRKATDLQPLHEDAWRRNASTLFLLEKYEDALVSLNKYIQLNSTDSNAFYERGVILSKLAASCDRDTAIKQYQDAVYDFDKAIEMNPSDYNASLQKGILELKLGQYENSIESFNKSIKQNMNSTSAWIGIGDAFLKLKRCNDSLNAYERAIFLDKNNKRALLGKGDSFLCMNQFESALNVYKIALDMNGKDGESLERKARALFLLGQEASRSVHKAIEDQRYASNCSRVWETYGDVLNKRADDSEDREQAIEEYKNALLINEAKEIAPGDSTVNPSEIKRKIGLIYYQIGISELPQTDEEDLEYYNRFKKASEYFNKAVIYFSNLTEGNISDEAAWLMLGQCYHRQWQYNKAIDCYEKVASLNDVERLYGEASDGMPHIRILSWDMDNFDWKDDPIRIVFHCRLKLENLADVCGSARVSITIEDIELQSSKVDVEANRLVSKTIEVVVSKEEMVEMVKKIFSEMDISLKIWETVLNTLKSASKTDLKPRIISQENC